jgi:hypothetical protein
MKINKPIFIIGSGRSGTTILFKLLSIHPDVCWFSNYMDMSPKHSIFAILNRSLDFPVIGTWIKKSIITRKPLVVFPQPVEAGNIYHSYCGFAHSKKTTELDLTLEMENKFKNIIKNLLMYTKKSRFLSKQTANNQRIRIIQKLFPDAYYIHIIRDGRAVANSFFHVVWWENMEIWWLGYTPKKWVKKGKYPIELCGLHWKHNIEEILKNKHLFDNRYIEIQYEELVENTKNCINKITEFCELSWPNRYKRIIPDKLFTMNYKWKKELSKKQKEILTKILNKELKKFGYI